MFRSFARRCLRPATIAAALAVAAVPVLAATPAHAAGPSYTCDDIEGTLAGGLATGVTNCVASGGAPASGPITGAFTIVRRSDNLTATCAALGQFPSGVAETPSAVEGFNCTE
ncbi:hypothetical protein [Kitasatospora sp. SUK 42]|uniref:hypothetical protein n=1 Tax=Kitasatospora sp. SUK 42 TaxID=1588882 RepID=UPI0018CB2F6E|nr:hypothetical protein [Kitasatospora sp. SUK 42]MBV2153353.1 hypothetical protein [Kitasatospora sp. SUK 42]